jgi:Rod binding domain-containing protein
MSIQASVSISPASEPEFVRNGSAAVKRAYQEAVGFEEMLVEQLSKSMAQTGGLGESGEGGQGETAEGAEGAGAGSMNLVTSMLPQTLSEAVTRGGGLGLASQLTREIDPSAAGEGVQPAGGGASAGLDGGTSAVPDGRAAAASGAGGSA